MKLFRLVIATALIGGAALTGAAAPSVELLFVEDFEGGQQNRLGGFHEKYQAGDSVAFIDRSDDEFRGSSGHSLCIGANRQTKGFCGVWLQFFNFRATEKQYFDARPFAFLSFWVKGKIGDERFTVKLADRKWVEKEDSIAVGEIRQFLPKGVTKNWQEVLVPLASIKNLDLQQLGGLTIDFTALGQHTIFIDDISFKVSATAVTPLAEITSNTVTTTASPSAFPRAMWVWKSREVLADVARREQLFAFCGTEGVEQLWMQLQYKVEEKKIPQAVQQSVGPSNSSTADHASIELTDPDVWRQFLAEAHQRQIQIHGLDGFPEFAIKAKHGVPLALVSAVIEFNRQSAPNQRFDGIHFDNEPYLLPSWEDPTRRTQILREFLDLNVECQRRVKTHSDMKFGIDIPFWWHEVDTATGKPLCGITYAGKKKPVSQHCIDLFDQVGIMNYRDAAEGADGMIAHGQELLAYAHRANGARIYMGVETYLSSPADVWFVVGLPRKRFEAVVRGAGNEIANVSRIDNLKLHRLDDGQNIHLGLELPPQPTAQDLQLIQSKMALIAERFGAASGGISRQQQSSIRNQAEDAVRIDPEWNGFRMRDIAPSGGGEIAGFIATNTMLPKLTFADNTLNDLHNQLKSAENAFRGSKQFAGMAIHSYESFLKMSNVKHVASQR